jgi:hypothetical protein
LIPKLAFVSRRKVNCTGYQITVKEPGIGRLDRRILARIVFLKIILECDRVDVQDGSLGCLSLALDLHEGADPRLYLAVLRSYRLTVGCDPTVEPVISSYPMVGFVRLSALDRLLPSGLSPRRVVRMN